VINKHTIYDVYTRRHDKAIEYFGILKASLEKLKKEMIIVVEQAEVTFVRPTPDFKELKRENKQLKSEIRLLLRGSKPKQRA